MNTSLADGPGVIEWPVWSTTARVVVTEPEHLPAASALVHGRLAEVDRAASRFRPDSEVSRLAAEGDGRLVRISPVLADLVAVSLDAARATDGDVDPTLGADLVDLGYDRTLSELGFAVSPAARLRVRRPVTWRDVSLEGSVLSIPAGVLLDLGATAKARTADLCAEEIARTLGCGVMVALGGDLRVAGEPPHDGWGVLVQDGPEEPASHIRLTTARAVATSSTLHRVWHRGAETLHHILDPARRVPAAPVWRTVTVAAPTCVRANTLTTAAMVRGHAARALLESSGVAARLVAADGSVVRLGGWPA